MVSERSERARTALEAVTDPEVPVMTITELGILRGMQFSEDGSLVATITPTYSNCPAMEQIADDASHVLQAADVGACRMRPVLSPAWTVDWIIVEGQRKLCDSGTVPSTYVAEVNGARSIRLMHSAQGEHITCPQHGSHDTVLISAFDSTACKTLYHCRTCREPFGYSKPY